MSTPARRRLRLCFILFFAWAAAVGFVHSRKPLPAGVDFRGREHLVPARDIEFLADLTYEDGEGRLVHRQEIFDTLLDHIDAAEESILLDMFLFNSFGGAGSLRGLSGELSRRLADKKEKVPSMDIDVVTDPINTVYGGSRAAEIDAMSAAGVNVIFTDLVRLRDSNPLYSSFWRIFLQWFGNSDDGGILPHPFSEGGGGVTLRSYLDMINFKANHRKVFVSAAGGTGVTIVSSANPHDASSAHSNVALLVRRHIWRDVYETEAAVARLSGGAIRHPPPGKDESDRSPGKARVVLLTERRIKDEVLELLAGCARGDRVWAAMFYLSDRAVLSGLVGAAGRGAEVRLILDPNRDAFGFEKNGIPNRQTARELRERSEGAIAVRWYKTHGEQFHSKMVFIDREDGTATALLGSANLTRRNLDGFNLELDVRVTADASRPPMTDIRTYLERLWENRGGIYTVDYEEFEDRSPARKLLYRLQEFTGACSY